MAAAKHSDMFLLDFFGCYFLVSWLVWVFCGVLCACVKIQEKRKFKFMSYAI